MNPIARSTKCAVPVALVWSFEAVLYRVTPWPDVIVECRYGGEWIRVDVPPHVAAAAVAADPRAWRAYLDFTPAAVRELLGVFRNNRLLALQVAARCPDVVGALTETPALVGFVGAHAYLRGDTTARWHELNAVFERGGVFGVLEWLGLPASRQTVAILRNVVSPDLPATLLEPLRKVLWAPEGIFALARLPAITERQLNDACALAA